MIFLETHGLSQLKKYVHAMRALSDLKSACFGVELDESWEYKLEVFINSFSKLSIARTPKYHIIEKHIAPFIKKTGKPLGFYTEAPFESLHHVFKAEMSQLYVVTFRGGDIRGFICCSSNWTLPN